MLKAVSEWIFDQPSTYDVRIIQWYYRDDGIFHVFMAEVPILKDGKHEIYRVATTIQKYHIEIYPFIAVDLTQQMMYSLLHCHETE